MTQEELMQVKFYFTGHVTLSDSGQSTYADKSGQLGFCDITRRLDEYRWGSTRRHYRIGNTWYKTKAAFLKALADFNYPNEQ